MFNKLQYISQGANVETQYNNIYSALDAGCEWIQLRFKNGLEISFAEKIKSLCNKYNATLIINDYVQIAQSIDAHGVHLGLEDMSVSKAREILGETKIIGGTANTLQDVKKRINEQCNYIGLGPFRFTSTKEKLSPVLGLNGYHEIINTLSAIQKNIPIYAIGGITISDVESLVKCGVYGVAISGEITQSENKKHLIHQYKEKFYANINHS
ncbi:MAG: thiamine phosphate synthase [Bacteroidetes bacterium]|nr:thiamine phosphate synthase [Bacteroidota bacterium]